MKYLITVGGEIPSCPNKTGIDDKVYEIESEIPPRVGESAEYFQIPDRILNCYSYMTGLSCDYEKCRFGQITRIVHLELPEGESRRNEVLLDEVCPKCGHSVTCIYWQDGSGLYFVDHFMHQCVNLKCRHILEGPTTQDGGMASWESDWPNCSFCEREV